MTAITTTVHHPHRTGVWVTAIAAAVLLTGLVVGLVLAFTGSSGGSTPTRTVVTTSTSSGNTGPALCPGSKKDWTC